jgi:ribonuclease VapC
MLVVDTSALMAVLQDEDEAPRCIAAMATAGALLMSAGTLAELLVIAALRGAEDRLDNLLGDLALEMVPVNPGDAKLIAAAYRQWGKGIHPAGLNFGDCFAYVLAKQRACPLLFVGDDFAQTDVILA